MRFYNFHIGDYASHTRGLTPLEDLAYRRLIDEYFLHERPPSGEPEKVADDIGLLGYTHEVHRVLNKFFRKEGDQWVHDRIEADIADMRARAERARTNGTRGGRPARKKETESVSDETQPFTTHNPLPNNQSPHTPDADGTGAVADSEQQGARRQQRSRNDDAAVAERFARFWIAYPRKVGKTDALKAFMKLAPDEALTVTMIDAVRRHATSRDWQKDSGQFIPHPSTWLNGRRWEDEIGGDATDDDDPFSGAV